MSAMFRFRLIDLVALGPVIFYMLEKLAVPGGQGLVAVLPVDDELRQQGEGIPGVYV